MSTHAVAVSCLQAPPGRPLPPAEHSTIAEHENAEENLRQCAVFSNEQNYDGNPKCDAVTKRVQRRLVGLVAR